jgi:hypothetical protein
LQQQEEEVEVAGEGEDEAMMEILIALVLQEMHHPETGVVAQEAGARAAGA